MVPLRLVVKAVDNICEHVFALAGRVISDIGSGCAARDLTVHQLAVSRGDPGEIDEP